jgi:uncharacterized protein (DUF2267 family)
MGALTYDEFIRSVQERGGIDKRDAECAAIEVLQELIDRLTGDEAHDLLSQLPGELQRAVIVSPNPIPIAYDAFVDCVARELEISPDETRPRIRAVFATLREAVSWGEFQDVLEQLDPEYADLLA